MPLTIESYPHIAEAIIASAPPSALRSLRATCTWFKTLVDPVLYRHLSHEIATDATTTVPLNLPVDIFTNKTAISSLRVLDLHLGEYKDPNQIEIDIDDWGSDLDSEEEEEWKDDTARVFPRAAHLMYAILYGTHTSVFRHVLQNRHVPTVICPIRGRDFVTDFLEVDKATVGAYVPTNRVWIVARQGPRAGVLKMQLFKEKPLAVTVVLLPPPDEPPVTGEGEEGNTLYFYDSLVETAAFESTDTSSFEIQTPDGEPYPDTPATFAIVGIEAWDAAFPLPQGSWEAKFRRDFETNAAQRYDQDDAENHLKRLSFMTLQEWKDSVTEEEWEIVSGIDLE